MPTIQSAKKRMKTSEKSHLANKAVKSRITSHRVELYKAISKDDSENAARLYRAYCSLLDKALKKGVVKANTAGRRKSRAAAKLAAMA